MERTLPADASVSIDGKLVVFAARIRGRVVQCCISRTALEQHFWVPNGAGEQRLFKALADGRNRIVAAVERKILMGSSEPIRLGDADFTR